MANREHLAILEQGSEVWNQWRDSSAGSRPDLDYARLRGKKLSFYNFDYANLGGASLIDTDLYSATFMKANLSGATLRGARINGTLFGGANLSMATLRDLDLRRANLREVDLYGANLSKADLRGTWLRGANLSCAHLNRADLTGADLQHCSLVETNVAGAVLTGCYVYGSSIWSLEGDPEDQSGLVITPAAPLHPAWPIPKEESELHITVDGIELAQFVFLLLNHKKLRDVFNTVTNRGVLLLGRFGGGGIEVLRAVAEKLREMKYLPIIFDFYQPRDRNYTETIKTLAGLSRFVVVDLSGPSVPQELYATVPHFKIPFVPILEKGRRQYAMFADILEYDWVLKPIVEFDTTECLIKKLPSKIVKPAEKRHEKRQKILNELFGR